MGTRSAQADGAECDRRGREAEAPAGGRGLRVVSGAEARSRQSIGVHPVDGPPLAWAPNVSRVHRYLEGRVRSRREPPGVGSRQASFFGSRRCRAESQASRGATPASPRGSCQRRGSRSARGCRRAPDARGTRPPLSRIQARRTRGSLARVHCRRLIARQAPEAADGSRSDLCAITLAQVNDSDREPIEHGRRAMRPESGASRQQVRQPAQRLQRRQEAHLPDGHLLHRCENDVPPHRDPEAVHLLASKRGRTSSSSDRGALIHFRA